MNTPELILKTAFCCMACDGDIAEEEVALLNEVIKENDLFKDIKAKDLIDTYVEQINQQGYFFLSTYLDELKQITLSNDEQGMLVKVAIKTIEADKQVQYIEINFFKKIRKCLSISDEEIIALFPENTQIESYLLPDIEDNFDITWNVSFHNLNIV